MRRSRSHSGLTVNEELWLTSIVSYCDFLLIVPSLKVRGEGVFTRELEEDMRYMMEPPAIQTSPVSGIGMRASLFTHPIVLFTNSRVRRYQNPLSLTQLIGRKLCGRSLPRDSCC